MITIFFDRWYFKFKSVNQYIMPPITHHVKLYQNFLIIKNCQESSFAIPIKGMAVTWQLGSMEMWYLLILDCSVYVLRIAQNRIVKCSNCFLHHNCQAECSISTN